MSQISCELWQAYLPGEMPPDCTYEQFCAARDAMWKNEWLKWLTEFMKVCHDSQREWVIGEINELAS